MGFRLAVLVVCLVAVVFSARESHHARHRLSDSDRRDSEYDSDTSGSRSPTGNYLRIKVEIIKLTNDQGLISSGSHCDFAGTCDPVCYANLDTERPNADWPGAKPDNSWPTVFGVDNINSPTISVTIKKDICGPAYHEANLRIHCLDRDPASKDDLINQWNCPINREPSLNEGRAEWSPTFDCLAKYIPDKMKLTFRYQIFHITRLQCNTTLLP